MKRIKLMLLSLVLLAGVGTALAFKAKFEEFYCTTTFNGIACPLACPLEAFNSQTTSNEAFPLVCTTPATSIEGEWGCTDLLCAPTPTRLIGDGGGDQ